MCSLSQFLLSALKVRASERESNLFELSQRAQPKLNNEVVNSKLSTPVSVCRSPRVCRW